LPKRLHRDAQEALAKIYGSVSRTAALEAGATFTAGKLREKSDHPVHEVTGTDVCLT